MTCKCLAIPQEELEDIAVQKDVWAGCYSNKQEEKDWVGGMDDCSRLTIPPKTIVQ